MFKSVSLITGAALLIAGCDSPKHYYYKGEVLQTVNDMQTGTEQDITRDYNGWDGCEQYIDIQGVQAKVCCDDAGATIAVMSVHTFSSDPTGEILSAMDAVVAKLIELGYPVSDNKVRVIMEKVVYAIVYSEPGAYEALVAAVGVKEES